MMDDSSRRKDDLDGISREKKRLEEGRDFYFEGGLMVLTAHYLLSRGYCCGNGCRHCPYPSSDRDVDQSR